MASLGPLLARLPERNAPRVAPVTAAERPSGQSVRSPHARILGTPLAFGTIMGASRKKRNRAASKPEGVPCVAVVLEDERDQRDTLVALLTALGVPCVACSNLGEALLEVGSHPLALVLVDRHLPDGDGFEIARALRTRPCGQTVPIVAISAAVQRGDVEAALLAGCDAFLGKPCTRAALVSTLERLLHRRLDVRRPVPRAAAS